MTLTNQQLEARILAQDQRLLACLASVVRTWHRYGCCDERSKAARWAVYCKILWPSRTAAIAAGGLLGLVGIALALQANALLSRQNEMIAVQAALEESSRRSALVIELSAILDQVEREVDAAADQDLSPEPGAPAVAAPEAAEPEPEIVLSQLTRGRIIALSRSLRPYRYLESVDRAPMPSAKPGGTNATMLESMGGWIRNVLAAMLEFLGAKLPLERDGLGTLTNLRSPERGQLLIALLSSGVNLSSTIPRMDLAFADLGGADLIDASLTQANFVGANLSGAFVRDADLVEAFLAEADLSRSDLRGSNLSLADLRDANLRDADLRGVDLTQANLDGADLTGANVSAEQVTSACTTSTTKLDRQPKAAHQDSDHCAAWNRSR